MDKMYEDQSQVPEAADIEREVTFQLAIDIDNQLMAMSKTLKETVEKLNDAYSIQSDPENPVGGQPSFVCRRVHLLTLPCV